MIDHDDLDTLGDLGDLHAHAAINDLGTGCVTEAHRSSRAL